MTSLQIYFFREIFGPLLVTASIMALLALLTQSLSSIELIMENRASLFAFLKITSLSMPQLLSIILPFAVFVAVAFGVQRLHTDNEVVVGYAAGLSQWGVISPVLQVVSLAVLLNLFLNLFVQPLAFRSMREAIYEVRSDLAASIIRPGEFVSPANKLTIFAKELEHGVMKDVFIHDGRDQEKPVILLAKTGVFTNVTDRPAITLHQATRQTISTEGTVEYLAVSSTSFELNGVIEPQGDLLYKYSDRYVSELLWPDLADYWEQKNANALIAEGHYRMSSPLYNYALCMLALAALLGGDFSKMGYGRRMAAFGALALVIRLIGFSLQSASADNADLNSIQYIFPLLVCTVCFWVLFKKKPLPKMKAIPVGVN